MRVDFYLLTQSDEAARLQLACRLVEKAYKLKHLVYLNMATEQQARTLDSMLWTFRDTSFLPHNAIQDTLEPAPPIQYGVNQDPVDHRDILINFSETIPDYHHAFNRIIEIVPADTNLKQISRDHFKYYKQQNYTCQTHPLD